MGQNMPAHFKVPSDWSCFHKPTVRGWDASNPAAVSSGTQHRATSNTTIRRLRKKTMTSLRMQSYMFEPDLDREYESHLVGS